MASAASKQPPADLLSISSESEVRLTPFPSLLSSFPLCRQIQLLNDRRVRPPARPSAGRVLPRGGGGGDAHVALSQ